MYFHHLIKKGDTIAIVAPSGKISSADLDIAIEVLESWGLEVILGKNVYCQYQNFAGTDAERISDLQSNGTHCHTNLKKSFFRQ